MKKSYKRIVFLAMAGVTLLFGCKDDRVESDLDFSRSVEITGFQIGTRTGDINHEAGTIVIAVAAGTNLASVEPSLTLSAGAVVSPAAGEAVNLTGNLVYTVTNGNLYKRYTVSARTLKPQVLSLSVDGAEVSVNEVDKEIVLIVPFGKDLSGLMTELVLDEEASVVPASGSTIDYTVPVKFTVVNGPDSAVYNVIVKYAVTPNVSGGNIGDKLAFIGSGADRNSLPDDDEQAAANFFFSKFPSADYLSWDAILGGGVNIYDYKVIWWHYDQRVALPEQATQPAVIDLFASYLKDGGSLFLSGYACQYFWTIGRFTNQYRLAIGDGSGFENNDTWGVGVTLQRQGDLWMHNMSKHPVYSNINMYVDRDGYQWFPVIGPGWKEDHNFVIHEIPPTLGISANDSRDVYHRFTQRNQVEWLGVWGGIRDYWMVGILEVLPNDEFKGRGFFVGIAGIEWNQNAQGNINPTGINPYQDNIEKLTENIINYLANK